MKILTEAFPLVCLRKLINQEDVNLWKYSKCQSRKYSVKLWADLLDLREEIYRGEMFIICLGSQAHSHLVYHSQCNMSR